MGVFAGRLSARQQDRRPELQTFVRQLVFFCSAQVCPCHHKQLLPHLPAQQLTLVLPAQRELLFWQLWSAPSLQTCARLLVQRWPFSSLCASAPALFWTLASCR